MAVLSLSKDNFDTIVGENNLVVIDFTADWCEPCQAFSQSYEKMAADFPDAVFAQIDVGKEVDLANDFNIRSVPMIMILRYQVAIFMQSGVITVSELERLIQQARALSKEDIDQHIEKSLKDSV